MKSKNYGWIVGLVLGGCLVLGIYNFLTNPNFLETNLSSLISICLVVGVSYFLVQRRTDHRRKKEKIDKLLYKIQEIILKKEFIESHDENLIIQRSVANKIKYLEENVDEEILTDINRLREKFEEFREFYGENYRDASYMKKSKKHLMNYISLMDDCCDKIHIELM